MPIDPEGFENELRGALRREPAPADFARRLKARLPVPIWRRPAVWAIAAVLLLAALIPPSVSEYQRRRRERGLEAGRQLVVALTITRVKFREVRERVQRSQLRSTTRHRS